LVDRHTVDGRPLMQGGKLVCRDDVLAPIELIRQDHLENLVMKTIKVGIGLLLRLTRSGKIAKNHAATSQR